MDEDERREAISQLAHGYGVPVEVLTMSDANFYKYLHETGAAY